MKLLQDAEIAGIADTQALAVNGCQQLYVISVGMSGLWDFPGCFVTAIWPRHSAFLCQLEVGRALLNRCMYHPRDMGDKHADPLWLHLCSYLWCLQGLSVVYLRVVGSDGVIPVHIGGL